MLLQKKALKKKALQKKALDFCLENQSCDRRKVGFGWVFVLGSASGFYHHAQRSSGKIACDGSDLTQSRGPSAEGVP